MTTLVSRMHLTLLLRSQVLWGIVLIAIGLVRGKSVFLGDFGILAIVFDAVGVFAIITGLVRMSRARQRVAPPPNPEG